MFRAEIKVFNLERFMLLGDLGHTGILLSFLISSTERGIYDKTGHQACQGIPRLAVFQEDSEHLLHELQQQI